MVWCLAAPIHYQNQSWLVFSVVLWHSPEGDFHDNDVIMGAIASQITSLTIVYSTVYLAGSTNPLRASRPATSASVWVSRATVYSDANQRKHQSSAPLAFVRGIHRRPVNSLHKGPVTRKMFPFDDVIMINHVYLYPVKDHLKLGTTSRGVFMLLFNVTFTKSFGRNHFTKIFLSPKIRKTP